MPGYTIKHQDNDLYLNRHRTMAKIPTTAAIYGAAALEMQHT